MEAKEQLEAMKVAAEKTVAKLEADLRTSKARLATFTEAATVSKAAPLAVLRKLQEKCRREEEEIGQIETQIVNGQARVSALEEAIKLFPKDGGGAELRDGSQMAGVRDALRAHGKPMSLTEILKAIGSEGDDNKRNSLRGSLASYARDGRVFTKEAAPETFGLIEFK